MFESDHLNAVDDFSDTPDGKMVGSLRDGVRACADVVGGHGGTRNRGPLLAMQVRENILNVLAVVAYTENQLNFRSLKCPEVVPRMLTMIRVGERGRTLTALRPPEICATTARLHCTQNSVQGLRRVPHVGITHENH